MNRAAIAMVAALTLPGCAGPSLDQAPTASVVWRGNYQELADCAYSKLSGYDPAVIVTKADLPSRKTASLTLTQSAFSAVKLGSLEFVGTAGGSTRIETRSYPTVWGPNFWGNEFLSKIAVCQRLSG